MFRTLALMTGVAAAALLAQVQSPVAQSADPEPIVNLMHQFAGNPKNRPSGAKGQCFKASFEPTAEARGLSKAVIFTKTMPVVARLSVGGGNPKVADGSRGGNRGFSFRIDPGGAGQTEFSMINAPMFGAKSAEQMLGNLQVRVPGADGKPDADKIKAFVDANPEVTAQGRYLASQPIPGTWAGITFHGVHAYTLTNAAGANQMIKFKMVPLAEPINLTDDEAKAKPADYLVQDITERLATGKPWAST